MRASREEQQRSSITRSTAAEDVSESAGATPQRLTYLVKQLQEAMRARLAHITQQFGLTPRQYTALSVLAKHPGTSSAHLARLTFVTPQAANEMVTTLENKGFLKRSVHQANRRRLEVEVTRAGITALAGCNALVDQLERYVFRDIGRADEAQFRQTLQTCLASISDPNTR
jgi:DNA-binding MarR family transcriptional regulator